MRHTWRRWWPAMLAILGVAALIGLAYRNEADQSVDVQVSGPSTTPVLNERLARVRFPARGQEAGFSDVTYQDTGTGSRVDTGVSIADEVAWARGAGATVHRIIYDWRGIEPEPGKVSESHRNAHLDFAQRFQAAGGRVLVTLGPAPVWARAHKRCPECYSPPADTPAGLDAWRRYVRSAAQAFPEAIAFEIWNEPNIPEFWGRSAPEPERWARLANVAIDELRRSAPDTRILLGAIAVVDGGGGRMEGDDFLRAAARAGLDTDVEAVSWHAYTGQHDRKVQDPNGRRGWGPFLDDFRAVVRDVAPRAREWVTETGITRSGDDWGVSPDDQARGLLRVYDELSRLSRVDAVLIHQLFERASFPASSIERSFGVVVPVSPGLQQPTPAWCALREAAADPGPPPGGDGCRSQP